MLLAFAGVAEILSRAPGNRIVLSIAVGRSVGSGLRRTGRGVGAAERRAGAREGRAVLRIGVIVAVGVVGRSVGRVEGMADCDGSVCCEGAVNGETAIGGLLG